jgi:hypothetical protein
MYYFMNLLEKRDWMLSRPNSLSELMQMTGFFSTVCHLRECLSYQP